MMTGFHILFDLDGTLADTVPGIEYSLNLAIEKVIPGYPSIKIQKMIGPPIRKIVSTIFQDQAESVIEDILSRFRVSYDSDGWQMTQLFPDVGETLEILKSKVSRLSIVTNKPSLSTKKIVQHTQIEKFFSDIISPDSQTPFLSHKHDMLNVALKGKNSVQEPSVFVGDSQEDMLAAKHCGIGFIFAEYGYGQIPDSHEHQQFKRLKSVSELQTIEFEKEYNHVR